MNFGYTLFHTTHNISLTIPVQEEQISNVLHRAVEGTLWQNIEINTSYMRDTEDSLADSKTSNSGVGTENSNL